MTKKKTILTIGVTAAVAVLLVAAILLGALGPARPDQTPGAQIRPTAYSGKSFSNDGNVDGGHRSVDQVKAEYPGADVVTVSNENSLLTEIGDSTSQTPANPQKVILLMSDVTLPQVTLRTTHLQQNVVFDGNGYTINLSSTAGRFEGVEAPENDYFTYWGGWLRPMYGGVFVGFNEGTICNTRFVFTSDHNYNGQDWNGSGSNYQRGSVYSPHTAISAATFGIVTGINSGTIDNCYLDMKNTFYAVKEGCETFANHGRLDSNPVCAGGVAGAMYPDSVVSNSTFYQADATVLAGVAQGNRNRMTADRAVMAVVGGIAGNVTGSGEKGCKLFNCSVLSGDGCHIYALAGEASKDENRSGSAGSVIGGSVGADDLLRAQIMSVKSDTIVGMIVGWHGQVHFNWRTTVPDGTLVENLPMGRVTNGESLDTTPEQQIRNFAFLYEYAHNSLDAEGIMAIVDGSKLWSTLTVADVNGTLGVRFASKYSGSALNIFAATAECNMQAPFESNTTLGRDYGYIFWGIDSGNGAQQLEVNSMYSRYRASVDLSTPKSLQYMFGYIAGYSVTINGSSSKAYDGTALNNPNFSLIGENGAMTTTLNSIKSEDAYDGTWSRSTDNGWVEVGNKSNRSQTALPGTYKYEVSKRVTVGAGYEVYGYYDATRRVAAKKSNEESLSPIQIVEACTLSVDYTRGTDSTNGFVKDLNFRVEIQVPGSTSNELFDYFTYVYNGMESDPIYKPAAQAYAEYKHDKGSTGADGADYMFVAYKIVDKKPTMIAMSDAINVKVDNDAPKINARFFYENANRDQIEVSESDLNEYWWKNDIRAEFTIDDVSGVRNYSNSGDLPMNYMDGKYIVNLNGSRTTADFSVTFEDLVGLTKTAEYIIRIDKVAPTFNCTNNDYADRLYEDRSSKERYVIDLVSLHGDLVVGKSGWEIQYAMSSGDKPMLGLAQLPSLEWTTIAEFDELYRGDLGVQVDWNFSGYLYMRLRNTALGMDGHALYDDVYIKNSLGEETGQVYGDYDNDGKWDVRLLTATLYMSRNNLTVGNRLFQDLDESSLCEALSKVYDSTTDYNFDAMPLGIYTGTGSGVNSQYTEIYDSGMRIVYSRYAATHAVAVNFEAIDLIAQYSDSQANDNGDYVNEVVTLNITLKGKTDYEGRNYDERYRIVFEDAWVSEQTNTLSVPVTIKQYERTEKLARLMSTLQVNGYTYNNDETSGSIVYSTRLPRTLRLTPDDFHAVEFTLDGALVGAVGAVSQTPYEITASASYDRNVRFTVEPAMITVTPYAVAPTVYTDGQLNGDFSFQYDGKSHTMSATYRDVVANVVKDMTVSYYYDEALTDQHVGNGIVNPGTYYATLSTGDPNYTVRSFTEVWELVIFRGFLAIDTAPQTHAYREGNAVSYDVNLDDNGLLHAGQGTLTLRYYRYRSDAKYDPETGKMIGSASDIAEDPTEVGYYKVEIVFEPNLETDAYPEKYEALLIVDKAQVSFSADTVTHVYDRNAKTYDLVAGNATMWNASYEDNAIAVGAAILERGDVQYEYQDEDGKWYALDEETQKGWFSNVKYNRFGTQDTYKYRLVFKGDDHYAAAEYQMELAITPAPISGIVFDNAQCDYDGEAHKLDLKLGFYENEPGLKITYTYGTQTSDTPFTATAAGTYAYGVRIEIPNYQTYSKSATLTINRLKMSGITATAYVGQYDGKEHGVTLNGLTYDEATGYSYEGVPVTVASGKLSGYKDAGVYDTKVVLSAPNYDNYTIDVAVRITALRVDAATLAEGGDLRSDEIDLTNITSDTDLRSLKASFQGLEGEVACKLFFFDADGNQVLLKDGKLDAGTYTVRLTPDNANYMTEVTYTLTVASSVNVGLIVGLVVGIVALVAIVAAVVAIVVVKRKKKAPVVSAE